PPSKTPSFSKSKVRSSPRLLAVVKPCSFPPLGLPRESVTKVNVGMMPRSSSDLRVPSQSPSRSSGGRTNGNGSGARDRVPADASPVSSERAEAAERQSVAITIETQRRDFLCTTVYLLAFLVAFETPPSDLE